MPEPILTYASPAPARPGLLVAAFWLNLVAVGGAAALIALGTWTLTLTSRFTDPKLQREALISGSMQIGHAALSAGLAGFCAFAIRARRWRRLTRVLSVCPLSLFVPFGTIAGLFTYSVLGSPKIRAAYGEDEHAKL